MTPEEKQLLNEVARKLDAFFDIYYRTNFIDKVIHSIPVYFRQGVYFDNQSISTGKNGGTKFGVSATEKLSFYGATPIVRQNAISAPSGGATVDTESRTAITTIINTIHNLGLTA